MAQDAFALQQALIAASRDPGLRARAVSALRGVDVWTITWPTDPSSPRSIVSSGGVTALPVFTDERQLVEAAVRLGWQSVDGRIPHRRMHISEAMRYAKLYRAEVVVLDMGAEHALELDQGEMDLVSSLPSTRPPSASQTPQLRTSPLSVGSEVARASSRPPVVGADAGPVRTRPPADAQGGFSTERSSLHSALRPRSITPHPGEHAVSATFGAAPTSTMVALSASPEDALLDGLSAVLKDYPEVQWASLVGAPSNQQTPQSSIALRIEPAFRVHLPEISRRLREAAAYEGKRCDVVVLDTAEQMKEARLVGMPFYPWRKREGGR